MAEELLDRILREIRERKREAQASNGTLQQRERDGGGVGLRVT